MSEKYRKLIDDEDFRETVESVLNLTEKIDGLLVMRDITIKNLHELKKDAEESYDKSRKAKVGGAVASVTGSTLAIVGFGLSFVTFGASLGLAIPGAIIGAAGGVTLAGAEIGYYDITFNSKFKCAEQACKSDKEATEEINKEIEKVVEKIEMLAEKHKITSEQVIDAFGFVRNLGRGAYSAYRGIDSIFEVGKSILKITRAAGAIGRTAWATAGTAARVVSVVGVVFDVDLIPMDLGIMIKAAYDVDRYKKTGKSNSSVANNIGELIDNLEKNKKQIQDFKAGRVDENELSAKVTERPLKTKKKNLDIDCHQLPNDTVITIDDPNYEPKGDCNAM